MRIMPANGTKIRELINRILGGIHGEGHAETQESRIPKPDAPSGGARRPYTRRRTENLEDEGERGTQ